MDIKELRAKLGSTWAVAMHLGVSQQTVKNWLSGRARPTAVTVRLLALLDQLEREAPDVAAQLVGWSEKDERTISERLDELGTPSQVADLLGVSRPVVDAWRKGATSRLGTVVRLLDVLDYVREVAPEIVPAVPVVEDSKSTATREEGLRAMRTLLFFARQNGDTASIAYFERLLRAMGELV